MVLDKVKENKGRPINFELFPFEISFLVLNEMT